MTYLAGEFLSAEIGRKLIAPAALLILPVALPLWFRHVAQGRPEEQRAAVWLGYLQLSRFVMAATLAGWWAIWDLNRLVAVFLGLVPWLSGALAPSSVETLLFWIPPAVSLAAFLTLANATSAALLRLRWTTANILNLVCWRMMNFVVPLLMIETGFDDLFRGELRGLVWVAAAGIVATVATAFLRKAEGMKLHAVKSGETRNRALAMARKMGVTVRRIYVVPAGRGHLTNAFAGAGSIGLTDNLGKYLNRQEIDL